MTFKDPSLFRQAALIGGEWIEADAANAIDVVNPATGELVGRVPKLDTDGHGCAPTPCTKVA